jgi:hypothetical protein
MIPYVDVSLSQKDYDTMEPFLPPLPRGGEGAGTPKYSTNLSINILTLIVI